MTEQNPITYPHSKKKTQPKRSLFKYQRDDLQMLNDLLDEVDDDVGAFIAELIALWV